MNNNFAHCKSLSVQTSLSPRTKLSIFKPEIHTIGSKQPPIKNLRLQQRGQERVLYEGIERG